LQADLGGDTILADISNDQVVIIARGVFSDVICNLIGSGRLAVVADDHVVSGECGTVVIQKDVAVGVIRSGTIVA